MYNPMSTVRVHLTGDRQASVRDSAAWARGVLRRRPLAALRRHRQRTPDFIAPPALGPSPVEHLVLDNPFVLWEHRSGACVIVGTPGHGKSVGR